MSRIKEFNLPDLGEGLTEGEILAWLVKVGDVIELNQPIVEVETAKAAVEIPAKWAGEVRSIFHPEGSTVEVGTPIIAIDTDPGAGPIAESTTATATPDLPTPSAASLAAVQVAPAEGMVEPGLIGGVAPGGRTAVLVGYGPRNAPAKRRPRKPPTPPSPSPSLPTPTPTPTPTDHGVVVGDKTVPVTANPAPRVHDRQSVGGPVLAKPPVRKLAKDLGVDLGVLAGSGPLGSITREDVQRAVAGGTVAEGAVAGTAVAGGTVAGGAVAGGMVAAGSAAVTLSGTSGASFGADREQRIPVKGVRRLTAENMARSAFTAPHVTEFLTVDVTRAMKALDRLRDRREWRDVRVSPLLLVAKAVLLAVRRHPMVNSTWAGDEIVVKEYVNLGIAAATERGLIVPNVKDAGRLTLRELADALTGLVQTAKAGKTSPADMSGGTLTITNVGVFGVDTGTPILPPGEAAILAFGAVRELPWVHKGKVRPRLVTTLGLSFDHRIIDGELGSKFLRDIGDFLADPEAALLAWT
ncbi:2-oxo acid dehydrogenase subunit E2 [Micromonospora rifamycinica]|uniref:dihydrolipoamide acetyltransferase family protein n=1 Tax=Micromonospora rifamycinica TaxID=291594 RepID=UPI002E2B232E|nr:dihydrolipoamide acetyltransferase family protein [Micromonospora rifamycinica]